MRDAALAVLSLAAVYLVGIGFLALFARDRASRFFRRFAQTIRANLFEMACRFAVGAAFLHLARDLPAPGAFRVVGGFLCGSAVVLALAPRRHRWFADRVMPAMERALPVMGLVALTMGVGLAALVARLIAEPSSPY